MKTVKLKVIFLFLVLSAGTFVLQAQECSLESESGCRHQKRCCRHHPGHSVSYEDSYIHPAEERPIQTEAAWPSKDEDAFYEYFTR